MHTLLENLYNPDIKFFFYHNQELRYFIKNISAYYNTLKLNTKTKRKVVFNIERKKRY